MKENVGARSRMLPLTVQDIGNISRGALGQMGGGVCTAGKEA